MEGTDIIRRNVRHFVSYIIYYYIDIIDRIMLPSNENKESKEAGGFCWQTVARRQGSIGINVAPKARLEQALTLNATVFSWFDVGRG